MVRSVSVAMERQAMIKTTHLVLDGHIFNRDTDKCDNCGMPRPKYEDTPKPCPGRPQEKKPQMPRDEEE